jgi:hypothetical protein
MLGRFCNVPLLAPIFNRLPPDPGWKFQRQTEPPAFGWARLVGPDVLEREVRGREPFCRRVLEEARGSGAYVPGRVTIVVLSCRRWELLRRLTESMRRYCETIEPYPQLERVLVDNGSGEEFVRKAEGLGFYDRIVAFPRNLGMVGALRRAYREVSGEFILFVEDDFVLEADRPFLGRCLSVFREFPEVGIVRLKNQNNWWKPHRVIAPLRATSDGVEFWTWLPSSDGRLNVWCAGSVLFRTASYRHIGELPEVEGNPARSKKGHQGYLYECVYGKEYNRSWLAAKIKEGYPFLQPNDNPESAGWGGSG